MQAFYGLMRAREDAPREFEGRPLTTWPSEPDKRNLKYASVIQALGVEAGAPKVIDYRKNLPEAFDQMQRGSCGGSSVAWGPRPYQEINQGDYPMGGFAAGFLYTAARSIDGLGAGVEGTTQLAIYKALHKWGIPPERVFPYSLLSNLPVGQLPTITAEAYKAAEQFKITSYAQVLGQNDASRTNAVQLCRQALEREGPFSIGMVICDNFIPDASLRLPLPAGTIKGLHLAVICGDQPDKGAFWFRNTWGKEWGDKGHALLPYEWLTQPFEWGTSRSWAIFEGMTSVDKLIIQTAAKVQVTAGDQRMIVDGNEYWMDIPAQIINGRMMVPSRSIASAFGLLTKFEGQTATFINPAKQQV